MVVLIAVVSDAPPTPPSISKHIEDSETKMPFSTSLKLLFKNVYFVMYMVVFSELEQRMITHLLMLSLQVLQ